MLFAFFVVMFASTQSGHGSAKEISEAVQNALNSGATYNSSGHSSKPPTNGEPIRDLTTAAELLRSSLKNEIAQGAVNIRVDERGIVIGLNSAVFFSLGDDRIEPRAYAALAKVAQILNRLPNALRLEGHTDSLPINNARFHDNWELSAARSIAMLRLLNERQHVVRERMAVVGYADTHAISSNDTAEGRERNRRVDIVIAR